MIIWVCDECKEQVQKTVVPMQLDTKIGKNMGTITIDFRKSGVGPLHLCDNCARELVSKALNIPRAAKESEA